MFDRILIILAALLFLIAEKTNSQNFCFSAMQISDALPVQFWFSECQTFNEYQAPGVYHKCFFAPWECEDEIFVQFKDDPSQNYSLEIYGDQQNFLGSIEFEEPYVGVYEARLNIAEDSPDVCDQLIYLQIKKDQGTQGITIPVLSDWDTTTLSGNEDWTTGSAPTITLNGTVFPGVTSEFLFVPLVLIEGLEYTFNVNYTKVVNIPASNPRTLIFSLLDDSFNVLASETETTPTSGELAIDPGPRVATFVFTAPAGTTQIALRINEGSNTTYTINQVTGTRVFGSSYAVARTDLLNIQREHDDTILLTYSNHRNFAGLVYSGTSPQTEFQIRIPAIFFHQRFPEEDEVTELSTELLTLNGTVRKQRQLTTDFLPYYFHEKLKLILKHQSLSIFNREWVKQEAYEIVEGQKRYPLKVANCWLSEKDFVHRNVL